MPDAVTSHPDPRLEWGSLPYLSRLLDRPTFFEHLRRAMVRNDAGGGSVALLVMALDPFIVAGSSDTWDMRDEVCTVAAGRLVGCLHHSTITGRVAGDEFLVLTEGIRDAGGAIDVSEQILMAVRWPEPLIEENSVTASVGIALQEEHMVAEQILINADIAMYSARRSGGNRYQVFEEWMRDAALTTPLVN